MSDGAWKQYYVAHLHFRGGGVLHLAVEHGFEPYALDGWARHDIPHGVAARIGCGQRVHFNADEVVAYTLDGPFSTDRDPYRA